MPPSAGPGHTVSSSIRHAAATDPASAVGHRAREIARSARPASRRSRIVASRLIPADFGHGAGARSHRDGNADAPRQGTQATARPGSSEAGRSRSRRTTSQLSPIWRHPAATRSERGLWQSSSRGHPGADSFPGSAGWRSVRQPRHAPSARTSLLGRGDRHRSDAGTGTDVRIVPTSRAGRRLAALP
jgi:hypothetical protein